MNKLKILYLEDDLLDVELVNSIFDAEQLEYQLEHVKTRFDFIAQVEQCSFDIILADYSLPSFDGMSALKIAREKCPDTPFIIVSGKIGEEFAIETLKSGATDYVLKQRLERLVPAVQRALHEAAEHQQRKKAELDLEESNRRYADLVEKAGIAILIDDNEGNLKFFNRKVVELFGYTAEELEKFSIRDLVHAEDVEMVMNYHQGRILKYELPARNEFRGVRKDTKIIYLEADAVEIWEDNILVGARFYIWDITERKLMEQELERYRDRLEQMVLERTAELAKTNEKLIRSEERYRALYEKNPTMYFTVDPDGMVLSVNQFGASQLGYAVDELVGKSVLQIFYQEDQPKVMAQLVTCLQKPDQIGHWEFRKARKDGSIIWVRETARIVQNTDGNTVFLIVCEDITDRIHAQQEKQKLQRQLSEAEKLVTLGQFMAAISHEINNPLDIILNELYPLKKNSDRCPESLPHINKIKQQVHRINHIAQDILNYARPHDLKFKLIDVNVILHRAIESLSDYFDDQSTLDTAFDPNLPLVLGDEIGLEIVFKNVVLNAIQSIHRAGRIRISTRIVEQKKVEVIIKDTGQGIPKQDLNNIFERFYTTKRKSGGTGLGLAISNEIIKKHNGEIKVNSVENKGTMFRIFLPARQGVE